MVKLAAPTASGTISHEQQTYEIVKGVVEVPAAAVKTLCESHGFKPHGVAVEGEDIHDLEPKIGPREAALKMLDKMERPELLAAIASSGITFLGGRNNQQLRAMLREHIEAHPGAAGRPVAREPEPTAAAAKADATAPGKTPAQKTADANLEAALKKL